jgi:hypothetical protein
MKVSFLGPAPHPVAPRPITRQAKIKAAMASGEWMTVEEISQGSGVPKTECSWLVTYQVTRGLVDRHDAPRPRGARQQYRMRQP